MSNVKRTEVVTRTIYGNPIEVIKIVTFHPQHVQEVRDQVRIMPTVKEPREYDIPFEKKYIIEKGLIPFTWVQVEGKEVERGKLLVDQVIEATSSPRPIVKPEFPKLDVLAFDLEVYNPEGTPRPKRDPIIVISLLDNKGFQKALTFYSKQAKTLPTQPDYVEILKNEKELLQRFLKIIEERDPEILLGFNSDSFDIPYLRDRLDYNRIPFLLGREPAALRFRRGGMAPRAKIKGRINIDIFPSVRRAIRLANYTLDVVAHELLGREKPEIPGYEIWKYWEEGGEKLLELIEYSLSDVEVTLELGEKLLPQKIELARLIRQPLFDVARVTAGQIVEYLLMAKAYEIEELIPNKPRREEVLRRESEAPIVGAYVKEPERGLHKNILVFDFKSMYPTVIVSHNIDPSTINCVCCTNEKAHLAPEVGFKFCAKRRGFFPTILEELINRRMEIKKKMKTLPIDSIEFRMLNVQQEAIKVASNAFYGTLAYSRFRWYCKEAAASVTAYGRYYITKTIDLAEKFGLHAIYADTDSLFTTVENNPKEKAFAFIEEVNKSLPGIIQLEFQGFYPRGLLVTKKRYALAGEDGRITARGLEVVRRDWAPIAKKTQRLVLEAILREGNSEKAAGIIRQTIANIIARNVMLEDMIIYTQLTREIARYEVEEAHVTAAKIARTKGRPVAVGSIIGYMIRKGPEMLSKRAVPAEEAKIEDYDPNYYIDNQVLPAVMRVMSALGYTEADLKSTTRQAKLF